VNLLFLGVDVYLIELGYPDGADDLLRCRKYIGRLFGPLRQRRAQQEFRRRAQFVGCLSGRTFSLCYAALEAAPGRESHHHGGAG